MENTAFEIQTSETTAERILSEILVYRRKSPNHQNCSLSCSNCSSEHLPKILSAVERNVPVTFVLPAFPGKSPNPEKVFGHLPDQGEKMALTFLGKLCERIRKFYPPGIKIILCSDGRVFSDVVGMSESHVTLYQNHLEKILEELKLFDISIFNLDNCYGNLSFQEMREELMNDFGNTYEFSKDLYCGITRFLFEDSLFAGQSKTRSQIQKEARLKAQVVVRRSNAWSELIKERFPNAVRLSIHPQECGSSKIGIRLVGNESWMTPWHGVLVETESGPMLLKKRDAEKLGGELISYPDGRPSHYKLLNHAILPMEER